MTEDVRVFREKVIANLLDQLGRETVQKLEETGFLEPFIQVNAWITESEKTLDHHEGDIYRLTVRLNKMGTDFGRLVSLVDAVREAFESESKRYDKYTEEQRQLVLEVSKASVEATDRLTKAVSSLESAIQKAIEDGKRPLMRPPGGL